MTRIGERRQRNGVRAEIHLALAVANGEWRAFARADQKIVLAGEQEGQCKSAAQLLERRATASTGDLPRFISCETRCATASVSVSLTNLQPFLVSCSRKLAKILDDAVVNDRNDIGGVRMSIVFVRSAMGRPTGMTDTDIAPKWFAIEPRFKRAQLAFCATTTECAVVERSNAGRSHNLGIRGV